ncbi:MAG: NAD(P)H-hydrate dehydratase, partial [Pyrinomonadaceae bacterium]|nr:NAD(P)H-hydrate dehydratase [Pyrinomonadaceae bacterium]
TRELQGVFLDTIQRLEDHQPYIVSIDIPSGLDADGGLPIGRCISADTTVTFTAPKAANVVAPASGFNGQLILANIGSPQTLIDEQFSDLFVTERGDVEHWLQRSEFSSDSFKNKRGHAMIVAGSSDYSGAAVLAGNAAMRSGVGLVSLACPAKAKAEIASRLLPEVILSTVESDGLGGHLAKADAVAVGCGLDADDDEIKGLVREIVETRTTPVIIDAGGLSFFSPFDKALQKPARQQGRDTQRPATALAHARASASAGDVESPLILTPHEGEFLRLLGSERENHPVGETPPPLLRKEGSLIENRVAAVREFATANNVILVLKGERVLIGHPDGRVVVNPTGNSGLGKAGNGDTLTGILAGFVAQAVRMNIDIFETVVAAVYVAGMAGDVAEKKYGKRVMTASDVRECLTDVFAELTRENPESSIDGDKLLVGRLNY